MCDGNAGPSRKVMDEEETKVRKERLLMRFMSNSSLLLKLVCGNIGPIIQEDYHTEYNDAITQKWLKVSQRFKGEFMLDYCEQFFFKFIPI